MSTGEAAVGTSGHTADRTCHEVLAADSTMTLRARDTALGADETAALAACLGPAEQADALVTAGTLDHAAGANDMTVDTSGQVDSGCRAVRTLVLSRRAAS